MKRKSNATTMVKKPIDIPNNRVSNETYFFYEKNMEEEKLSNW